MPEVVWTVTEHHGAEGLAALEHDWRRLFAEMPDPVFWHSHEAYSAYLDHLCEKPERFCCFALSDGERVRAILPLEERVDYGATGRGWMFPLRVWGMPMRNGWPTTDAIGPEDDARRALIPLAVEHLRRVAGRPAILIIGRTRGTSALWDGLERLSPSAVFEFQDREEFMIPTDMTSDEFMARLGTKVRTGIRRARRRWAELEGTSCTRSVTPDELRVAYEEFLDVEGSGWKAEHGTAIRQHPEVAAFYRDLLSRLSEDGHCEIHSLHIGDTCVASSLCVYAGHECAVLKTGYDEAYSHLSPGRLLAQQTFEWNCADPAVKAVSEISNARWLRRWSPSTNKLCRAYISLRPVSGALVLTFVRLWYGPIRRLGRAIDEWRRRRVDDDSPRHGREAV